MATRKVTRKKSESASRKKPGEAGFKRVVEDAEIDKPANTEAIESKDASKGGKPKIHAKTVSLIISVGTEDRERTHEEFVEAILKKIGPVPYGKKGIHAAVVGGYYILDGKVCLVDDYDKKTGTFKKGAVPPTWAGGPAPSRIKLSPMQEQMQRDAKELSSDEYDKKYQLGKYRPGIPAAEHQKKLKEAKLARLKQEEEELEELEEFLNDDEALDEVTSESASAAIRKLKGSKKRVVKKSAAPKKKTVRRVKK